MNRPDYRLLGFAVPLLLYLLAGFVLPVLTMLHRSVDNSVVSEALKATAVELRRWDGADLPADAAAAALAEDLRRAVADGKLGLLGRNLDYEQAGFRGLLTATSRALSRLSGPVDLAALRAADPRWGQGETWLLLQRASRDHTWRNLLAALDLKQDPDGTIQWLPEESRAGLEILGRTFQVAFLVSAICLVLALPVAFVIAHAPVRVAVLLSIVVLLPFWTPVLVRTTAWIVLLQNQGVINGLLQHADLIRDPLPLIYNRTGVLVAMTHVLLPYMVLPILAVMKGIPESYVRAGLSLGASPVTTLRRVYLPLLAPGIYAGCVLVFILALGYYVTPALVGGPKDQLFSSLIAYHTNTSLNWGMASALSAVFAAALLLVAGAILLALGWGRSGVGQKTAAAMFGR